MIQQQVATFIRHEYPNSAQAVKHVYCGIVIDKFRGHQQVEERTIMKVLECDYYLVQLQGGGKLNGKIVKFFPDEMTELNPVEIPLVSQRLIER